MCARMKGGTGNGWTTVGLRSEPWETYDEPDDPYGRWERRWKGSKTDRNFYFKYGKKTISTNVDKTGCQLRGKKPSIKTFRNVKSLKRSLR